MKKLTLSLASLALSAAPLLAQYPMAPSPYAPGYYAPAPWGYPQPVRPMMWAPPQMVPVYYMPQPYVQVVPVPVAKVQAAGAMTRDGIYPLEGYHPQLPAAKTQPATKPAPEPAAKTPTSTNTAANPANPIQRAGASWSSSLMPWLRPAHATTPVPSISGSVNTSLRNDLGTPTK